MRRVPSLLIVFVSLVLFVPCLAYSSIPIKDGLVGCWRFDEGSLVTAIDTSGNGNDGTMVDTTYSEDTPSPSLSDASLLFNNTHAGYAYSYVTIPDSPSLRPSSGLTLAAWVKTNSTEGRLRHIVSKQYGGSLGDSFVIWYHDDGRLWFASTVASVNVQRPSADEWHHIAGTYDGSFMRLYVDGVEQGNSPATGSLVYDDSPVLIGADCNNADHIPDEGWTGFIDEVLIYNRGLTHAEIAVLAYSSKLYGIIGNHLVTLNQKTGDATEVGLINASFSSSMFLGLTYDPFRDTLYAVANATTDPELIMIDRTTAQAAVVGPIDLNDYDPTYVSFVESLAFNPADNTLYGSAGAAVPYSNMLISVDPATGNATLIALITGTTENDGDTMVFINGTLYLSDSSPSGILYTVDLNNGNAVSVGNIGFDNIILAYNPEIRTLFGTAAYSRLLIEISTSTGQGTLIGPTHTLGQFEGAYVSGAAVVFDGRPPDIDIPVQDPPADSVQPYQNVTVSVNVADNLGGVKNVTLIYSLGNATTWEEPLTMNRNVTTGSYEAMIPGQPTGTWVKYKILAFDQVGNSATLEGEQPYLAYQVIPEFQYVLILMLFLLATIICVIAHTWRRKSIRYLRVVTESTFEKYGTRP